MIIALLIAIAIALDGNIKIAAIAFIVLIYGELHTLNQKVERIAEQMSSIEDFYEQTVRDFK